MWKPLCKKQQQNLRIDSERASQVGQAGSLRGTTLGRNAPVIGRWEAGKSSCELIHLADYRPPTYLCQRCCDQQDTYLSCVGIEKQKRYFSFQKRSTLDYWCHK